MHAGESNLMFNTNKGTQTHTCDGVRVEVPGLFYHVEESRDKRSRPGRQFAKRGKKEEPQSEGGRGE